MLIHSEYSIKRADCQHLRNNSFTRLIYHTQQQMFLLLHQHVDNESFNLHDNIKLVNPIFRYHAKLSSRQHSQIRLFVDTVGRLIETRLRYFTITCYYSYEKILRGRVIKEKKAYLERFNKSDRIPQLHSCKDTRLSFTCLFVG